MDERLFVDVAERGRGGRQERFSSHRPVLCGALERSCGSVLELGCGSGSTPFLHDVSDHGRYVLSIEGSSSYHRRFVGLDSPRHHVVCLPDPLQWRALCAEAWDVALVDSAPGETRGLVLPWLLHARFVVVHDTEPAVAAHYPGMHAAMDQFAFWDEARPNGLPWTRVLSNVVEDLVWARRS